MYIIRYSLLPFPSVPSSCFLHPRLSGQSRMATTSPGEWSVGAEKSSREKRREVWLAAGRSQGKRSRWKLQCRRVGLQYTSHSSLPCFLSHHLAILRVMYYKRQGRHKKGSGKQRDGSNRERSTTTWSANSLSRNGSTVSNCTATNEPL